MQSYFGFRQFIKISTGVMGLGSRPLNPCPGIGSDVTSFSFFPQTLSGKVNPAFSDFQVLQNKTPG